LAAAGTQDRRTVVLSAALRPNFSCLLFRCFLQGNKEKNKRREREGRVMDSQGEEQRERESRKIVCIFF